jgi:hypothetical protein
MIGIVLVCTNMYFILAVRFIKRFMYFYKGSQHVKFYMFTDTDPEPYFSKIIEDEYSIEYIQTSHTSWVDATNSKFTNIVRLKYSQCDYLFYFDADTNVCEPFTEEWFLGDLVGGEHSVNRCDLDKPKPFDRNPKSEAYVPLDTQLKQVYYYGAFFGGKKERVVDFCDILIEKQKKDKEIPYEPCWNDESYINHYFHYNPPKTIPCDKFKFYVSCKAGFENTRNCSLDISEAKKAVLHNNGALINIYNGKVVFTDK